MTSQNRIEGQFAIVSAFRTDRSPEENYGSHLYLIDSALEAGIPVEQLKGQWDGVKGLGVRVYGPAAAAFALRMVRKFKQDAFITASDGKAVIYTLLMGEFWPAATYTQMVEAGSEGEEDDYSETMSGFRFRFK